MKENKTYIIIVSKGFGEYTEVYTATNIEEAYNEVKEQLKDKLIETAEDYALVYELISEEKCPKYICNDSDILKFD